MGLFPRYQQWDRHELFEFVSQGVLESLAPELCCGGIGVAEMPDNRNPPPHQNNTFDRIAVEPGCQEPPWPRTVAQENPAEGFRAGQRLTQFLRIQTADG